MPKETIGPRFHPPFSRVVVVVDPVDDSDLDPVDSVDPSVEPVPTIVDPVLDPALLVYPTDQYPAVEAKTEV